jgi:hypothetical protein
MKAGSAAASGARHVAGVSLQAILIVAIATVILLGLTPIYQPANFLAGAGQADAGRDRYSGYVWANPDTVRAGDRFDVYGCDYDTKLGNVIIGFTGGSWGSPLDSRGCFEIPDIPALSGDTLAGRWRVTGRTTVTVVE